MTKHEIDAMTTTFTLKDVIYIGGFIVTIVGLYWKVLITQKETDGKVKRLDEDVKENKDTMFKKFTNVHVRMERNEENSGKEVATLHRELGELKSGISSINGKLDILIDKK